MYDFPLISKEKETMEIVYVLIIVKHIISSIFNFNRCIKVSFYFLSKRFKNLLVIFVCHQNNHIKKNFMTNMSIMNQHHKYITFSLVIAQFKLVCINLINS